MIKAFIKERDGKPGEVFLGVAHRIDRPVSGAVLFAKTSKAPGKAERNAARPQRKENLLGDNGEHSGRTGGYAPSLDDARRQDQPAHAYASPRGDAKDAVLRYRLLGSSKNYRLLEVELITGRHHQIRCQLAKAGCPIKGDLKYGAPRSNPGGGISLHSRSLSFVHPVRREPLTITAPVPKEDSLWSFFEKSQGGDE